MDNRRASRTVDRREDDCTENRRSVPGARTDRPPACTCLRILSTKHNAKTSFNCVIVDRVNPLQPNVSKIATPIRGFDAGLANRPFLVLDFRALWRSGLSARVPESQKIKMVG